MATGDDTKLPLTSRDVHAERLAHFRALFPEACTEGKTDLKKLAQLLSEAVSDAPERYGLSWSGKSEAIRAIQITSPGTLRPCVEESWPPLPFSAETERRASLGPKGEDVRAEQCSALQSAISNTSENLIIEGDNLETLKLLQGGYHGRVKMIYIDPPYNTGGEFIYPDNYKEGLADYLRFSGQVSGEGIKLTTNAETDGRYHSKWLTMMYPRLFLARNLLREDGVIFVSIDDHEVHNLRAVMNEIFGEENFVAVFIWEKRTTRENRRVFSFNHDYVVCYARQKDLFELSRNLLPLTEEAFARYSNPDDDARGNWQSVSLNAQAGHATKDQFYTITTPSGRVVELPSGRCWAVTKPRFEELVQDNRVWFGPKGDNVPRRKIFLSEAREGLTPHTLWKAAEVGTTDSGNKELIEILGGQQIFDSPKPTELLSRLIAVGSGREDLILDFFAGSGTTAQAVLELNAQDGGNRKFILVQLPEPTERKDFPTIADITKERVRRVIKKLETELAAKERKERKDSEGQLELGSAPAPGAVSRALAGNSEASEQPQTSGDVTRPELPTRASATAAGAAALPTPDLGFKVFKLGSSNFKVWDAATAPRDGAGLAEQLKLIAHNVEDGRPDDALLYELILKSNLPLTSRVVAGKSGAQTFYDVADGTLAICLKRPITQETLRGLVARKPKGVICLDIAFAGNDQLKANTVLEMKSHGIEFHTA